ncbi:MAG TPA: prolipoprotein diacylglyceryl transferase [Polyangia bacterium]|nr:prolipoprotein diacylglyceryl transferase [Polyangia bacterium]
MRPVLFHIPLYFFKIPIHSYGVMLALSLVVGWQITLSLCVKDGMERKTMERCYVWTAAAAVAGSRLLYIFTNLDRIDSFWEIFKVWQGGLVAYGGFIGGFLGSTVYCRLKGIRLLAWADCAVPSLCTGLMITRIGCLLYGCDFGKVWDSKWAIHFPAGSPAFQQQRVEGLLGPNAITSLGVHPTQLYESLNGLILLGLCFLVRRVRTFSGQVFVAWMMGYAVLRYFVEVLRADEERGNIGPLSTSQFIGVTTFLIGAVLLVWLYSMYKRDPRAMRLWENGLAMAGPAVPDEKPAQNPNAAKRKRKKR